MLISVLKQLGSTLNSNIGSKFGSTLGIAGIAAVATLLPTQVLAGELDIRFSNHPYASGRNSIQLRVSNGQFDSFHSRHSGRSRRGRLNHGRINSRHHEYRGHFYRNYHKGQVQRSRFPRRVIINDRIDKYNFRDHVKHDRFDRIHDSRFRNRQRGKVHQFRRRRVYPVPHYSY